MKKCQGKKRREACGERIARGAGNQKSRMQTNSTPFGGWGDEFVKHEAFWSAPKLLSEPQCFPPFFHHRQKNFIKRNDGFTCKNCGTEVPILKGSCRNHCTNCLYSFHIDLETPGDRANSCLGLMKPTKIDYSGKKGFMLIHQCLKCNHITKNKVAPDDEKERMIKIMNNAA